MTIPIEVKIIDPRIGKQFPLPAYATPGSAGMDICACIDSPLTIEPGQTQMIHSGMAINIKDAHIMAVLVPRSGLGIKHGIVLANLLGIVDSDYQGEIQIGVWNRGALPFTIAPGDRICQMLFVPVLQADIKQVDSFSEVTRRGSGGFGHTGK
jgi:dUTP pyrophosphatase